MPSNDLDQYHETIKEILVSCVPPEGKIAALDLFIVVIDKELIDWQDSRGRRSTELLIFSSDIHHEIRLKKAIRDADLEIDHLNDLKDKIENIKKTLISQIDQHFGVMPVSKKAKPEHPTPVLKPKPRPLYNLKGPSLNASSTPSPQQRVFISYAHADAQWLERLQLHLKPLERAGQIDRWDDTRIKMGMEWRNEIKQALAQAKVAVLLVSAAFLASDFIADNELPPLLAAAENEGALILPIILSPCRFERTPALSRFQAANSPSRTLEEMSDPEWNRVLVAVSERIEEIFPSP